MRPALLFGLVLLALAPVAAPLLAAGHPLSALLIRSFFAQLCHQNVDRSFLLDGSPVAVCVRCLGIYCGAAMGGLMRVAGGRRMLAAALLANLLDVATAMLHWHGNLPLPRFCLGLWLGWCAGALLVSGANRRSLGIPGFPVKSCGHGGVRAPLFSESRMRGRCRAWRGRKSGYARDDKGEGSGLGDERCGT